jgi:hypothetical protein
LRRDAIALFALSLLALALGLRFALGLCFALLSFLRFCSARACATFISSRIGRSCSRFTASRWSRSRFADFAQRGIAQFTFAFLLHEAVLLAASPSRSARVLLDRSFSSRSFSILSWRSFSCFAFSAMSAFVGSWLDDRLGRRRLGGRRGLRRWRGPARRLARLRSGGCGFGGGVGFRRFRHGFGGGGSGSWSRAADDLDFHRLRVLVLPLHAEDRNRISAT